MRNISYQAGTPHLKVLRAFWDKDAKVFEIAFKQFTLPTPGQPEKKPQVIPIKFGCISKGQNPRELLDPNFVS